MENIRDRSQEEVVFQEDLKEIMKALGMGVYARPKSPHRVAQEEVIPYAMNLKLRQEKLEGFVRDLERECQDMQASTGSWYESPIRY